MMPPLFPVICINFDFDMYFFGDMADTATAGRRNCGYSDYLRFILCGLFYILNALD